MMKPCLIAIDSYFPTFRQRHRPGVPVLFELVEARSSDGATRQIPWLRVFVEGVVIVGGSAVEATWVRAI